MDERWIRALCQGAGHDVGAVDLERLAERLAGLFEATEHLFTIDTTDVEPLGAVDPRWS